MKKILIAGIGGLFSQIVLADVSPFVIQLNCQTCHSCSVYGVADLNTDPAENIRQALLDFKYDKRQSTVMGRIAKGFTDSELTKVANLIDQSQ